MSEPDDTKPRGVAPYRMPVTPLEPTDPEARAMREMLETLARLRPAARVRVATYLYDRMHEENDDA